MIEHTHIRGVPASYAQCVGCKERLVQMMDADEQGRALEAAVVEAAMAAHDFEDRVVSRTPYEVQMSPDDVERELTRLHRARTAACDALRRWRDARARGEKP